MGGEKTTASYKLIADSGGNRYRFYCDLSGALICTTGSYRADSPEEELQLAWQQEGQKHFNICHRCGKFVSDAMFNVEVLECVKCAPYEAEAKFCKSCGARITAPGRFCSQCGNPLAYEGKEF